MRILHTADWHLGDRLGRIDRTADLRRAVERVAALCDEHRADVLLVAGDLFSEMSRPDSLRASIEHLRDVFTPFLRRGGTILAVTGNHDNETFCQTLRLVMNLVDPSAGQPGEPQPTGRLYLATGPTSLRLAGSYGEEVQFLLMPYPTPARYLRGDEVQRYAGPEERHRQIHAAFLAKLNDLMTHPSYRPDLPTVLAAHVHVLGAELPSLFRMSEEESVVFAESDLPAELAYVALGHIHQPQYLHTLPHVRYCGSIERLDLGERRDDKGVVLVNIGPEGRRGDPEFLPLDATPVYEVEVHTPLKESIEILRRQYPDAKRDLVRLRLTHRPGVDDLEGALRELEEVFPNWYARDWQEVGALGEPLTLGEADRAKGFEDTVRDYLRQELTNHPDGDRDAVLSLAETLMAEVGA
jgi:exonuclease SbcD